MPSIRSCTLAVLMLLAPPTAFAEQLTPFEEPRAAPVIEAPDLAGAPFSTADLAGKVVVVNFWATWCPPCVKELPSMQRLWERFRARDFVMLAVNVGESVDEVDLFLQTFDPALDFPVVLDSELAVVKAWPVFGLPTTFVVDGQGMLAYKALGERDWEHAEIAAQIEALLDGGSSRGEIH